MSEWDGGNSKRVGVEWMGGGLQYAVLLLVLGMVISSFLSTDSPARSHEDGFWPDRMSCVFTYVRVE